MKALVVRLSAIGDVVHTLPALAALHRGGWDAGWVVEPAARSLVRGHPFLSQVAAAPSARSFRFGEAVRAVGEIRARGYDVALDFQGLWKSAVWARLAGATRTIGWGARDRREPGSASLLGETTDRPTEPPRHVIDWNLALLRPLGIEARGLREFPLPPTEREAETVAAALGRTGLTRFVILNPGGGWASKLWPAERYGELARALVGAGLPCIVTWGPGEDALADRVVAASRGAAERCFPTTLLESVELARRASVVVAADTGPLHLACAVGTPVVGLFGPTDPGRNGPFSKADVVVHRAPVCFPCHRRNCPRHATVMESIGVDEVRRAVDERLGRPQGTPSLAV